MLEFQQWQFLQITVLMLNLRLLTLTKKNDIDTFNNSSTIVILTKWEEYKVLNFNKIYAVMSKPSFIFDVLK